MTRLRWQGHTDKVALTRWLWHGRSDKVALTRSLWQVVPTSTCYCSIEYSANFILPTLTTNYALDPGMLVVRDQIWDINGLQGPTKPVAHQQNILQSLEASGSVWEDVECKLRSIDFRRVLDPRRAFWPPFAVTGISADRYRNTRGVIVISLRTSQSTGENFECTWEYLGVPATCLGAPPTSLGSPTASLGSPTTNLGSPTTNLGSPTTNLGSPTTTLGAPWITVK